MSIKLTVEQLKNTLNILKPVMKKETRLVLQPNYSNTVGELNGSLSLCAAQPNIVLVTSIKNFQNLTKDTFPNTINIDFKQFNDLISLSDKEGTVALTQKENGDYVTLECELLPSSDNDLGIDIIHELHAFNESRYNRSSLKYIDYGRLTAMNNGTADVTALNRQEFIENLTHCVLSDNTQVILSAQAHAYATCSSQFVVYVNNEDLDITATLNIDTVKILCNVLKQLDCEDIHILADNEKHLLFISDEKHEIFIQLCQSLAKKSLVNQINGFHTADYSEHHTIIKTKQFETALKAMSTLTADGMTTLSISHDKLRLGNKASFKVDQTDKNAELTCNISIDTLQQMLKSLNSDSVYLSTTIETEDDTMTDSSEQEKTSQRLMRLAEYVEDNVLGAKTYCLI